MFSSFYKRGLCLFLLMFLLFLSDNFVSAEMFSNDLPSFHDYKYRYSTVGIKSVNGRFYAYVVLLFNENPHFVNIIQKGTVSIKEIGNEGFHVKAYRNYLASLQDKAHYDEAALLLKLYNEPAKFSETRQQEIADSLAKRNIILKFRVEGYHRMTFVTLDYCIYGEKVRINVKHPLLDYNEDIYYIKPFIYYDEFSTSNSTFYYDMIYINSEEVENDYIIARDILRGKDVKSMFFVGSRIDDNVKQSLLRAFTGNSDIKGEIWKMFVIHEITHKLLDNHFENEDQVSGEELSMSSTIYSNPFLGLAVLYSYLNYSNDNPHRIAALNFVEYASAFLGNKEFLDNPGLLRNLSDEKLKELARSHFFECIKRLKK